MIKRQIQIYKKEIVIYLNFFFKFQLTNAVGITGPGGPKVHVPPPELYQLAAAQGPYIKLAALSGAAAVCIGAIASHSK